MADPTVSMLAPYRVVDLTDERGLYCGALLGSLGADVIQVEPPAGNHARRLGPFLDDGDLAERSLFWKAFGVNRRSVMLDLETEEGRADLRELMRGADVVLESAGPGGLGQPGLSVQELLHGDPNLIVTSVSPFGLTGPRSGFSGSDLICYAMSGALYAAGGDGGRPPTRPSHLPQAYLQAGTDAAWATAVALLARTRGGRGQHIDVSITESMERCSLHHQIMWQVTGQTELADDGSYRVLPQTPFGLRDIWRTLDGYVSFGIFLGEQGERRNPRLISWMAEDGHAPEWLVNFSWRDYFDWAAIPAQTRSTMTSAFADFFASKTTAEIMATAIPNNIMIQPEHSFQNTLDHPQLRARRFFHELPDDSGLSHPGGFVRPTKTLCEQRRRAPRLGEHSGESWLERPASPPQRSTAQRRESAEATRTSTLPLAGVKVVDFCWAIAGAVSTGMLANLGAQVIRIESSAAIDFNRENGPYVPGDAWQGDRSAFWANIGNSSKLDMRLNLKHPRMGEVIDRLLEWGDVVCENFPGGRMAKYGLGYDDLVAKRPDLIMLSASMYGQTGPWAELRGNGAALLSQCGLSQITGYPDGQAKHPGFVYSDYFVPKHVALALAAALDHRERTGEGQYLDVAQLETAIAYVAPALMARERDGVELIRIGNRSTADAPSGLYACEGKRRWLAISVDGNDEWQRLRRALGDPAWAAGDDFDTPAGRIARQDEIDAYLEQWAATRTADAAMEHLQHHGVAAGVVQNGKDLLHDPQLAHRGYFHSRHHPALGEFTYSGLPARFSETPYTLERSPLFGEHTEFVCAELLGLDRDRYDELKGAGVFE